MYRFLPFLLLMLPSLSLAEPVIDDAWIKHLPPAVPVRAGYMKIYNPDNKKIVIESVSSSAFETVEIHRTVQADGMTRMEKLASLVIEAESGMQLEPGGTHLMMINPTREIAPGDQIEIVIKYDLDRNQTITMMVKK